MEEISAGAIVYTKKDNKVNYLISKDFHNNWGFPKGHLENDETEIEAAIREIKEEVGVDVSLNASFKETLEYIMPNGINKKSIYFLACFENQIPKRQLEEVQEIKILPYDKARQLLTFDNMKEVLDKANKILIYDLLI